ncbi:FAD-dependent oxidoreductase [Globicatella sulfidifaciens]
MKKILIVGGVAGGMSAATRLRRLMEDVEIIVFDKGPYVSFANCGLPYHVSGEIADRQKLIVQSPEALRARFDLDVRPNTEVLSFDLQTKTVTVQSEGQESTEQYDVLILSPGAKPFVPPIIGLEAANNTHVLRSIPDLDGIMANLNDDGVKQATVIGAGFIGIEMAENLAKLGLAVTIVEKAPHVLPPLDEEMAQHILLELEKNNIQVITNQSVVEFKEKGHTLVLEDGTTLNSDLNILSVGVQPENSLAKEAGIKLGLRGGIVVDDQYRTNVPDIYAVGDAIVVKQQITGQDALISLASPANRQGRQVADIIAGLESSNKGSIGTAIVRVFKMTAASTGLNERTAKLAGLNPSVVHISGKSHASYFPGAEDIDLKLVFNRQTGEIYGAQAVGKEGVDKRIDIIATAIKGGLTIFDLPELEFTYAPPFGSAKDPVNMAGYAASNLATGVTDSIQWYELNDELAKGKVLLDVRNDGELQGNGRFKEAIHIPLDQLRERLEELDKNQPYVITCHSGLRSYIGERILKQHGFTVENLDGAFSLYHLMKPEEIVHV